MRILAGHGGFKSRGTAFTVGGVLAAALLVGCASGPGSESPTSEASASDGADTITVSDNHGDVSVPAHPQRVVALDNTALQTLSDWDIPLVAAPKGVMGNLWPKYSDDPEVLDVGNHREPNLEAVIAADPDLIIGGYRFASAYDDLRKIQPATIEINARDDEDRVEELQRQTTILGEIFGRQADAAALNTELDESVSEARDSYNGTDTVVGLISSGGKLAYAAPTEGRAVGILFPALDLKPGIATPVADSSHGDEISVEAIAQASPDWLVVLDRDGALQTEDYVPAKELIEQSEALQAVPAVQKGQVIYLDPNFYLTEGIQAYTQLFDQVGEAFRGASATS